MPAVVIRQCKAWRRRDSVFLYFEDNAGVIVNPKGEMKGSAATGPVAKQCVSASASSSRRSYLYSCSLLSCCQPICSVSLAAAHSAIWKPPAHCWLTRSSLLLLGEDCSAPACSSVFVTYYQSGSASSRPAPLDWLASSRHQCPSFPHHVEHCSSVLACLVSQRQAFRVPRWRDVSSIVRPSCSGLIRFCRPILLLVSLSSPHLPFITDHLHGHCCISPPQSHVFVMLLVMSYHTH